jgi:ribosome-binding factor A
MGVHQQDAWEPERPLRRVPADYTETKTTIMESTRQAKIARLIQKELSEILRLQTAKTHGTLVSVSAVRVSPDMSIARAYLSIFPSEKGSEILDNINANSKSIRYELGQKVRFQLRKIPELYFHLDDSLDYIENIDNLLKQG